MEYVFSTIEKVESIKERFQFADFEYVKIGNKYAGYFSNVKNGSRKVEVFHDESLDQYAIMLGRVYDRTDISFATVAKDVYEKFYKVSGWKAVTELEGEFNFAVYDAKADSWEVIADREGIGQLFYRCTLPFGIASNQEYFMAEMGEEDIDLSALFDFVSYGTILGNHTFSKHVVMLAGGHVLRFSNGQIAVERFYRYEFNSKPMRSDFNEAMEEAYTNAFKKRVTVDGENVLDKTVLLTSGGMDCRLMLATCNKIKDGAVHCVTFGQKEAEENDVARKVAAIRQNSFEYIEIKPDDFIEQMPTYTLWSGGADMSIQGFNIPILEKLQKEYTFYLTGFMQDLTFSGAHTSYESICPTQKFSDFIKETKNRKVVKWDVFREEELQELAYEDVWTNTFGKTEKHIDIVSNELDRYENLYDAIQLSAIENRGKNTLATRENGISRFMDPTYPVLDRKVADMIKELPPEERSDHKVYRKFFMYYAREYADVVYNNTNLAISVPWELWERGIASEAQREKIYEEAMIATNGTCGPYKHYYSDFNYWTRFDNKWKWAFETYLLNSNASIVKRFFKLEKLQEMYEDHCSFKKNNRRKLIHLLTMEMFYRVYIDKNA